MQQRGDRLFVLSSRFDALVATVPLPFELRTQGQLSIAAYPLVAQHAIHEVKLCITVFCEAIWFSHIKNLPIERFVQITRRSFSFLWSSFV